MNEQERQRSVTNSVSAIVVALDLMERLLSEIHLGGSDRAAVEACLHEMNESVALLRSLVTRDPAESGEGTS
jgi:hypothetical protein